MNRMECRAAIKQTVGSVRGHIPEVRCESGFCALLSLRLASRAEAKEPVAKDRRVYMVSNPQAMKIARTVASLCIAAGLIDFLYGDKSREVSAPIPAARPCRPSSSRSCLDLERESVRNRGAGRSRRSC